MHEVQPRWALAHTVCAKHNTVCRRQHRFVSLIENDVLASLKMMLTASGQTMLCPADTNTKKGAVKKQSKKSEVHDNPWVSDNFFIKNRYLRRNFKIVLFLGYKEQTDRFCRLKVWITF